jgi:hypothetical protein
MSIGAAMLLPTLQLPPQFLLGGGGRCVQMLRAMIRDPLGFTPLTAMTWQQYHTAVVGVPKGASYSMEA